MFLCILPVIKIRVAIHRKCLCCGLFALNRAKCKWETKERRGGRSPVLFDQILLDIPHVQGVIFNIRFTHLRIVGVTWDF